jgi:hypothetical protein
MPIALEIAKVLVRSLDVGEKEVSWTLPSTTIDVLDYTFQILRSESPRGPFEPVTEEFVDRYIFIDRSVPVGDKFRQLWYLVRIRRRDNQEFVDSEPVTHEADPDLHALYIRRSQQTLFTQAVGRACWLFKRRTFGTRCTSCWDPVLKKQTRSGCLDCFDTGFLRGFLNPIEVWVQIDPAGKSKTLRAEQLKDDQLTSARMTFFPPVSPGDVLVELENKRWTVTRVTLSERLRAPIKQELVLRAIDDTDIEYKLPINLDTALRDIQASPGRMFVHAADLEAAISEQTPNIFAIYTRFPRGNQ